MSCRHLDAPDLAAVSSQSAYLRLLAGEEELWRPLLTERRDPRHCENDCNTRDLFQELSRWTLPFDWLKQV